MSKTVPGVDEVLRSLRKTMSKKEEHLDNRIEAETVGNSDGVLELKNPIYQRHTNPTGDFHKSEDHHNGIGSSIEKAIETSLNELFSKKGEKLLHLAIDEKINSFFQAHKDKIFHMIAAESKQEFDKIIEEAVKAKVADLLQEISQAINSTINEKLRQ